MKLAKEQLPSASLRLAKVHYSSQTLFPLGVGYRDAVGNATNGSFGTLSRLNKRFK